MRKILVILLVLVPMVIWSQNNQGAERRVRETIAELKRSAYEGYFTILAYNVQNDVEDKQSGDIMLKGEKFCMTLAGNVVKYDGKTQWVFISEYNEVSITEPTAEELRELNPLAMIEHYMATNRIVQGENGEINFYPYNPKESEYFRVELHLSKYNLPKQLIVYQNNGNKITIYLDELKKVSVDNSYFVFDIVKYPNVEVNDLR